MELFEVLWQQEDATSMLPSIELDKRLRRRKLRRVRVHFRGREFVLDDAKKEMTMGRAEENDIVVKGTLISRLHAKIECVARQVPAGRPEHERHVRDEPGGQGSVRAPRFRDPAGHAGSSGSARLPEPNAVDAIRYQLED